MDRYIFTPGQQGGPSHVAGGPGPRHRHPLLHRTAVSLFCGIVLSIPAGAGALAAPVIAYTSGTLGVLIGADLLNLDRIRDLGAPMVTFDGIFLEGVIAAFLA